MDLLERKLLGTVHRMAQQATLMEVNPVVVHTRLALDMDDEQFFEFCQINRDWQIERTA